MPPPPLRRSSPGPASAAPGTGSPLPRWRTVAGGAVLGGVLLVGASFLGGTADRALLTPVGPSASPPGAADQPAPLRAVQPQVRPAPPDTPEATAPPPAAQPEAAQPLPGHRAAAHPAACPSLFEEPARLAHLGELPPVEVTGARSRPRSSRRTGAPTHTVFRSPRAGEAHTRLHVLAGRCREFHASLPDGTAVTVRLSAQDETYRMTVDDHRGPALAGWLAIDRAGPVVTVRQALYPTGSHPDEGRPDLPADADDVPWPEHPWTEHPWTGHPWTGHPWPEPSWPEPSWPEPPWSGAPSWDERHAPDRPDHGGWTERDEGDGWHGDGAGWWSWRP